MGLPLCAGNAAAGLGHPRLALSAHLMPKGRVLRLGSLPQCCVVLLPCHHKAALPEHCPPQEEF